MTRIKYEIDIKTKLTIVLSFNICVKTLFGEYFNLVVTFNTEQGVPKNGVYTFETYQFKNYNSLRNFAPFHCYCQRLNFKMTLIRAAFK